VERRPCDRVDELERGREAYAGRSWVAAHDLLSRAHEREPLQADDLELIATTAFMLGRDDECVAWLEQAHQRHLDDAASLRAVRCAAWMIMNLALRGQMGPATGWLGRAHRLLETEGECAERGWLAIPGVFEREAAGDFLTAAGIAA